MEMKWVLSFGLLTANLVFAQSNQSTCLPVLAQAVAAVEGLNEQISDANRNVEQILKRYDAFLNNTFPNTLEEVEAIRTQVKDTTELIRTRLSVSYMVGVSVASTTATLGVGILVVAGWRALRKYCCPLSLNPECHCQGRSSALPNSQASMYMLFDRSSLS